MKHAPALCGLSMMVLSACGGDRPSVGEREEAIPAPGTAAEEAAGVLGAVPVPEDNPMTESKIALGHQLFFDSRLSVDGSRSCYSCHRNEDGNGGAEPRAIGAGERQLPRHSPVIWNVGYMSAFYWDGRAGSLEAQAKGAWGGGNMGVGAENLDAKAAEVGSIPGYAQQFQAVFGDRGATGETVAEAIAAYERTLVCDNTRYDRFLAGEVDALTEEELRGRDLFNGKAACAVCHTPPYFSVQFGTEGGVYYNVGIGIEGMAEEDVDAGRQGVTDLEEDWAAFKVPSLRNVAESAPYFHDGSVPTLAEAILYMAGPGVANRNLTPLLMDRGLSDEEVATLAAFLAALNCPDLVEPELPGT